MARKKTLTIIERRDNNLKSKRTHINNKRKEERLIEAINNYFEYGTIDKKIIKTIQLERYKQQNTIEYQQGLVDINLRKNYNGFITMTFNDSQLNYKRGIYSIRRAIEKYFDFLMKKQFINRFFCVFELTKDSIWHAHAVINICNPLILNLETYLKNSYKHGILDFQPINDKLCLEKYLNYMVKCIHPAKNNFECLYWFESDLLTHLSNSTFPKGFLLGLNKLLIDCGVSLPTTY